MADCCAITIRGWRDEFRYTTGTAAATSGPKFSTGSHPSRTEKQLDAYGRLLELERDQRQVLAALVPSQADAIRNAEPYVPLLALGPRPDFLGVSGADQTDGGARLTELIPEGPADNADLRVGDVILGLNKIRSRITRPWQRRSGKPGRIRRWS